MRKGPVLQSRRAFLGGCGAALFAGLNLIAKNRNGDAGGAAGAFGAAETGLNFLRKTGRKEYRPVFHRMAAEAHIKNRSYLDAARELDTAIRQDPEPTEAAAAFARVGDASLVLALLAPFALGPLPYAVKLGHTLYMDETMLLVTDPIPAPFREKTAPASVRAEPVSMNEEALLHSLSMKWPPGNAPGAGRVPVLAVEPLTQ